MSSIKKILGVIPARWGSTRFPGKPLADLCGKPMIRYVYEHAKSAKSLFDVAVATDDERICNAVLAFGGRAVMTSADHPNGTSRAEEALRKRSAESGIEYDAVINIQGDEPLLDAIMIDEVAEALSEPGVSFATLCRPLSKADQGNPNVVKVVMAQNGDAMYFSRSLIPYPRHESSVPFYQHIGIYGYTSEFLRRYAELPMTPMAEAESLEQLKALEHGYKIRVKVTSCKENGRGVDTPEDLEEVRKILMGQGE